MKLNMSNARPADEREDHLLLREIEHRCVNDLQLVVSALQLQARRAASEEARRALQAAADRVTVLARARNAFRQRPPSLEAALCLVSSALSSQTEPRSIVMSLSFETDAPELSEQRILALMLIVNELATNAIKHAFDERGGRITITVQQHHDGRHLVVAVEDDGVDLPDAIAERGGMGLDLARRFAESIGCRLVVPGKGSKRFEIRVPVED